jgi:hypothetical protein
MVSSIDGARMPMRVNTNPFPQVDIDEAAPVPAAAFLVFTATFGDNGISESTFLEKWQSFSVVIKYDDKTIRHEFDRSSVLTMISSLYPQSAPHVSKRQS